MNKNVTEELIVPGIVRCITEKLENESISLGDMKIHYNHETVETVFKTFLSVLEEEIEKGNSIRAKGYFSIKPTYRSERPVRNVHDNTEMIMPAQYRLKIKTGQKLNDACKRYSDKKVEEEI